MSAIEAIEATCLPARVDRFVENALVACSRRLPAGTFHVGPYIRGDAHAGLMQNCW